MKRLPKNNITRRFKNVTSSGSSGIDPQVTKEDARKIRSLAHQISQENFEDSEQSQTLMNIESSDPEYVYNARIIKVNFNVVQCIYVDHFTHVLQLSRATI
jgi:hypothetical protein